jgi:aminopeptidase N
LHFEKWKDASDALGESPYVKGALFLHELRTTLGDAEFWRVIARYSQQNRGRLVDSSDFQRACEEVTSVDLRPLFQREVYGL